MKLILRGLGLFLLTLMIAIGIFPQMASAEPDNSRLYQRPEPQVFLSKAPPTPPRNQEKTGSYLNDLVGAPTKKINTTIFGQIVNGIANNQANKAESLGNVANRYYNAYQTSGNMNTYNNFVKNADKAHAAETNALQTRAVGKVVSGALLVNSISKYNDPSKHRHSSLAFVDRVLRGVSIGTSAADLAGYKPVKPVGIVVGIVKDAYGGDTFSDIANNWDNPVINTLDKGVDAVNNEVYEDMLFWYNYFNNTEDADVFGKPPRGVGVYKPNIYLYPIKDTRITVNFNMPALLTKTIPSYHKGWQVIASPDGQLKDTENGTYYDYLFYESMTDTALFTYNSGWVIHSDTREEQFRTILSEYGFNEREIADFVEFWKEKLDSGIDYVMYPQLPAVVNSAMPIQVSPEPAHSFRLWFAFETFQGNTPALPVISKMDRRGYMLVEWGGFILDEQK